MTIKNAKSLDRGKLKIDLRGPEGNAFVLLGYARRLALQLNKNAEAIAEEMMKGDYEHLLKVFDREFGDYVDLYR